MPDNDPQTPYHPPQAADQDAVNEHKEEAEGPFGSDMTNLLGGTRSPEENTGPPDQGNAYNTGTETDSGHSLSASDPRSRFGHTSGRAEEES